MVGVPLSIGKVARALFTALIVASVFVVIVAYMMGYHVVWPPTEDQLYGCTVAQQAPNGECR